jgi:cadmium resistance protein CadD (predicted permease)
MKSLISKILGVPKLLWAFVWPLVTKQVGMSLTVLLPIALGIVKELAENNNISNSEKREQAFEKLADAAKNEGMNAANSLLNLAIEMAVTNLKVASKD